MIIVCLATGFEEIEALTPTDVLRRHGLDVKTVAIGTDTKQVCGSHGITVVADMTERELCARSDFPSCVEHIILPGGMPGSLNLDASDFVEKMLDSVKEKGGHIAAICAAPLVLGRRGFLKEKKATCFPGFENELDGAEFTDKGVVRDGNIITAKGAGVAIEFGLAIAEEFAGKDEADKIYASIQKN